MSTERNAATRTDSQRTSVLKIVGALAIIGLAAWFIFSNLETISVRLWFATVSLPMWITLLVTFLAGWLVGLLVHRRRRS